MLKRVASPKNSKPVFPFVLPKCKIRTWCPWQILGRFKILKSHEKQIEPCYEEHWKRIIKKEERQKNLLEAVLCMNTGDIFMRSVDWGHPCLFSAPALLSRILELEVKLYCPWLLVNSFIGLYICIIPAFTHSEFKIQWIPTSTELKNAMNLDNKLQPQVNYRYFHPSNQISLFVKLYSILSYLMQFLSYFLFL